MWGFAGVGFVINGATLSGLITGSILSACFFTPPYWFVHKKWTWASFHPTVPLFRSTVTKDPSPSFLTFCPTGEHIAQVDHSVGRVVVGDVGCLALPEGHLGHGLGDSSLLLAPILAPAPAQAGQGQHRHRPAGPGPASLQIGQLCIGLLLDIDNFSLKSYEGWDESIRPSAHILQ